MQGDRRPSAQIPDERLEHQQHGHGHQGQAEHHLGRHGPEPACGGACDQVADGTEPDRERPDAHRRAAFGIGRGTLHQRLRERIRGGGGGADDHQGQQGDEEARAEREDHERDPEQAIDGHERRAPGHTQAEPDDDQQPDDPADAANRAHQAIAVRARPEDVACEHWCQGHE